MKRFQELIVAAAPGRKPWEAVPETAISAVAAQCGAADIADIIAELEALAGEKSSVPAWDGDAQDDIGKAQELFARILGAVPAALLPAVAEGLNSPNEQTLSWIKTALATRAKS